MASSFPFVHYCPFVRFSALFLVLRKNSIDEILQVHEILQIAEHITIRQVELSQKNWFYFCIRNFRWVAAKKKPTANHTFSYAQVHAIKMPLNVFFSSKMDIFMVKIFGIGYLCKN